MATPVVAVAASPPAGNRSRLPRRSSVGWRPARSAAAAAPLALAAVLVLLCGLAVQPQLLFSWAPRARGVGSDGAGSAGTLLAGADLRSQAPPLHGRRGGGSAPGPAALSAALPAFGGGAVQVKQAATSMWLASGIGPVLLGVWAKLAPFPPFSWLAMLASWVAAAPVFYRYYMLYSLGSMVLKRVIPGTYAQLTTGTWLSILKSTNTGAYADAVATRLQGLLVKQAALRAEKGKAKPTLSQAALDAMATQVKNDAVLLDALGSTTALGMWHKLEKTPLEDPSLVQGTQSDSQVRWLVEALRAGYLGDVETVARESALEAAAANASQSLKKLVEAVDATAFRARYSVHCTGAGSAMASVEEASAAAAASIKALEDSRVQAEESASGADRGRWEAKLQEMAQQYADVPAVANELQRLSGLSESTSGVPA